MVNFAVRGWREAKGFEGNERERVTEYQGCRGSNVTSPASLHPQRQRVQLLPR